MSPTALCALMLVAAIDYGYEPMENGGIRYLIRIEPHMVDLLNRGQVFGSDIPPEVAGRIRAFRVYSADQPASKAVPAAPPVEPPALRSAPVTAPPAAAPPSAKGPLVEPPAVNTGPAVPDLFRAPQAFSPAEDIPRQLPKTEKVEHAVAISPEGPAWPEGGFVGDESPSARRVDSAPKPYFPLILAVLAAVGSSTGMLYFGWLAFDYRARYRRLLRETLGADPALERLPGERAEELPEGGTRDSPVADRGTRQSNASVGTGKADRKSRRYDSAEGPPSSVRDWLEGDEESG